MSAPSNSPLQGLASRRFNTLSEELKINIYRLSKFLSSVAMTSAVAAISVTFFGFPPIGYGGMVFISSVAVALAIGAAVLSLLLSMYLVIRQTPPRPTLAIALSLLALALAFTYVWTM